jgi:hypothetical protein
MGMAQEHDGHCRQKRRQMLDESFAIGNYAAGSTPQCTSIDNNTPRFHPLDSTTLPWRTLPMVI